MTIEKKNKLIYSGELILIALVFIVIAILELLRIIVISDRHQLIFKIVTLVGASWITFDFFWTLFNKKRRANNSLIDKIMLLPLAVYLYSFDIAGFVIARPYAYYQIGLPIALLYISCAYLFQGIYHYYHPIPLLLQAIEEEKLEKEKELVEKQESEVKEDKE